MAIAVQTPKAEEQATSASPEQALCSIFDIVEDALEKLPPKERGAWLSDLSETAAELDRRL